MKLVNRYAERMAKIKELRGEIHALEEVCGDIEEALLARAETPCSPAHLS